MKRKIFSLFGIVILGLMFSGWGNIGHSIISEQLLKSVNGKITGFNSWIPFIADHSSDPDYRKSWVKSEASKHFIDIDNYPEFKTSGSINTNIDALIKIHGEAFVNEQGTLPWATKTAFDSLRHCFEIKDWRHAKLWAADLSHYVGDGHMPLHLTQNYDGQETGNKGIHSRYESKMITAYSDKITGEVRPAGYINDVNSFIFNYLYRSNRLCVSIFKADNIARQIAGGTESPEYLSILWKNTSDLTNAQFNEASYALGSLIYTAWVQAGSPNLNNGILSATKDKYDCEIISVYLNRNNTVATIKFQIYKKGSYKLDIRNSDGWFALKAGSWDKMPGCYSTNVDISNLSKGNYLAVMSCANFASTVKVVKTK